jgi:hypothetical protein
MAFICSLSGREAAPSEHVTDADDDDELGEMPLDWRRISVQKRVVNPEWVDWNEALEAQIAFQVAIIPAEVAQEEREAAERTFRKAAEATFYARMKDIPKYVTLTDDIVIDGAPATLAFWEEIKGNLGLDEDSVDEGDE